MKPRQVVLTLRHPSRFPESYSRTARLVSSDFVERFGQDLTTLLARVKEFERATQVLRNLDGKWSEEVLTKARGFAAALIEDDLQRRIERDVASLRHLGYSGYIAQPPVFQCAEAARDRITAEEGVVYVAMNRAVYFGFPEQSLGEALIRALRVRQQTNTEITVGTKANEKYDHIFARLQDHLKLDCLPELLSSGVAFSDLDAYATLYCRNPQLLLQPNRRQQSGLREYPLPGRDEHARIRSRIRELLPDLSRSDSAGLLPAIRIFLDSYRERLYALEDDCQQLSLARRTAQADLFGK